MVAKSCTSWWQASCLSHVFFEAFNHPFGWCKISSTVIKSPFRGLSQLKMSELNSVTNQLLSGMIFSKWVM